MKDLTRSLKGKPKSTLCMDIQNRMGSTLKPAKGMGAQKCLPVQRKDNMLARPHNHLETE